jgi:AraC family transcriptional activator of pobA
MARFLPYVQTGNGPAFEAQRFGPGHVAERFELHGHRFHEVVVFDASGGYHRIGDEARPIHGGDIDVIAEGVLHDTRNFGDATGWMVLVRSDAFEGVAPMDTVHAFDVGRSPRLQADSATLERLDRSLGAIARERNEQADRYDAAMRAHLALIVVELNRLSGWSSSAAAFRFPQLDRLIAEIDRRLADDIRLPELADVLALTPAYLTAELRRKTGRTAMEWVTARRLRAARRLLLESELSIAEVAAAAGFADGSHLSRHFQAEFKTSPGRWRNESLGRRSPQTDPTPP